MAQVFRERRPDAADIGIGQAVLGFAFFGHMARSPLGIRLRCSVVYPHCLQMSAMDREALWHQCWPDVGV
jgi:hypothetical protein